MKKYLKVLLTLCIVLGMFSTAYAEEKKPFEYEENELKANALSFIGSVSAYSAEDLEFICETSYGLSKEIYEELLSYVKGDTLGEYIGITEEDVKFVNNENSVEFSILVDYKNNDLKYTFVYKEIVGNITIADVNFELVSEEKGMGEILKGAGLNTIMGISIVVIMLTVISFIISLFRFIPIMQEKYEAKKQRIEEEKNKEAQTVEKSLDTVEESEELVDDAELVAVIMAAVMASTNTSKDGFVVRSIRRRF